VTDEAIGGPGGSDGEEVGRAKPADGGAGGGQANPAREKDTEDWVTGEEPMTGPQTSYLQTLCQEAGEEFDPSLTKAQASKRIDELQAKTGRGR